MPSCILKLSCAWSGNVGQKCYIQYSSHSCFTSFFTLSQCPIGISNHFETETLYLLKQTTQNGLPNRPGLGDLRPWTCDQSCVMPTSILCRRHTAIHGHRLSTCTFVHKFNKFQLKQGGQTLYGFVNSRTCFEGLTSSCMILNHDYMAGLLTDTYLTVSKLTLLIGV